MSNGSHVRYFHFGSKSNLKINPNGKRVMSEYFLKNQVLHAQGFKIWKPIVKWVEIKLESEVKPFSYYTGWNTKNPIFKVEYMN